MTDAIIQWVLGGGLLGVLAIAAKFNGDMRQMRIDAAKAKQEVEAQKAKEAQFEANIAESNTKVAGEGILRGLLITLTQREQEAHKATALVMDQLQESRRDNGYVREELAEIRSNEEICQRSLAALQLAQQQQDISHREEMRAMKTQLNNRIYQLSKRLQAAGLAFTATDVVPDHGTDG